MTTIVDIADAERRPADAEACGAEACDPGEFTQRAFLNDKVDLAQAEAIADIIDAGSRQAVRAAMRSLLSTVFGGLRWREA